MFLPAWSVFTDDTCTCMTCTVIVLTVHVHVHAPHSYTTCMCICIACVIISNTVIHVPYHTIIIFVLVDMKSWLSKRRSITSS